MAQAVSPEQLDTEEALEVEEEELIADAARMESLLQLKRWRDLAAAICRKSALSRRQLIRLGLATRKSPTSSESPGNGEQTVPVPA